MSCYAIRDAEDLQAASCAHVSIPVVHTLAVTLLRALPEKMISVINVRA